MIIAPSRATAVLWARKISNLLVASIKGGLVAFVQPNARGGRVSGPGVVHLIPSPDFMHPAPVEVISAIPCTFTERGIVLELAPKELRLLELASEGMSSRLIAAAMGYQEGTIRVYLHQLYKKLGVHGKTGAAVWYLNHQQRLAEPAAAVLATSEIQDPAARLALEEGLFVMLGAAGVCVGPANAGGKGREASEQTAEARRIWRAMLDLDLVFGKRMIERKIHVIRELDSFAALSLWALLAIGGMTSSPAVKRLLFDRRVARPSRRAVQFVSALDKAVSRGGALDDLLRLAFDRRSLGDARQLALVSLFHVSMDKRHLETAQRAARELWDEALFLATQTGVFERR
jgi:DNA-binding CsgD family transcriptional regulator